MYQPLFRGHQQRNEVGSRPGLEFCAAFEGFELPVPGDLLKAQLGFQFAGEEAHFAAYQGVFTLIHCDLLESLRYIQFGDSLLISIRGQFTYLFCIRVPECRRDK